MRDQVLHVGEPCEMNLQLRVAEPKRVAQAAAAETHRSALDRFVCLALGNEVINEHQQAPRLRRQVIERAAQHFVG